MKEVNFGGLKFNTRDQLLTRNGIDQELNATELAALNLFVTNNGALLTRKELGEALWGTFNDGDVSKTIHNLRKKLGRERKFLKTLRDGGYRFYIDSDDERDNSKFSNELVRFFGESVTERAIKMVFAYRTLDGDISLMKSNLVKDLPELLINEGRIPTPEGVSFWIPHEDIRAAVYIASLISQNVKIKRFDFVNDDYNAYQATNCLISFGLFSKYTLHLSELCKRQLFQIVYGYSPKQKTFFTDNIAVENVVVVPDKKKDVAIVARIVSHPTPDICRVQFVVAGRTATGTAVAGYFLSQKYKYLLKLYDDNEKDLNQDSLAIILSHDATEQDDPRVDGSAEIYTGQDKKPMIIWAPRYEKSKQ